MKRFLIILSLFLVVRTYSQQTDYVDFQSITANLSIFPEKQAVGGFLKYEFKILKSVDSIFIDAINMKFQTVYIDGIKISFTNDGSKLWLKHDFKSDSIYKLSFNY